MPIRNNDKEPLTVSAPYRGWEYAESGEYHLNLDPNWSYTPTYLRKMKLVETFLRELPQSARIIDLGCGEGVLVREFRESGYEIRGLDMNYEGNGVELGDVRQLPYPDGAFEIALLLDVFEHLAFEDQPRALGEIRRILRPGGTLLLSVPNLAHLNSRASFLVRGRLDRTDVETNHPGERPISEYGRLIDDAGFEITRRAGITFTLPLVYRRLICRRAAAFRWLHDLMEPAARWLPSLAMINLLWCKRA